jgi:hypothetical protein
MSNVPRAKSRGEVISMKTAIGLLCALSLFPLGCSASADDARSTAAELAEERASEGAARDVARALESGEEVDLDAFTVPSVETMVIVPNQFWCGLDLRFVEKPTAANVDALGEHVEIVVNGGHVPVVSAYDEASNRLRVTAPSAHGWTASLTIRSKGPALSIAAELRTALAMSPHAHAGTAAFFNCGP